jgi:hypothetical protein
MVDCPSHVSARQSASAERSTAGEDVLIFRRLDLLLDFPFSFFPFSLILFSQT